jgi:hypothetical protein
LRLISLPLGMVVDIFGLLPDSAVFLVRRGAGRNGAKLVVRDCLLKQIHQANSSKRTIVPEQGGVAKEEPSSLFTTRGERPLELVYAQNRWDGCFRGSCDASCSPVDPSDPSRMPRVTAWPGNNWDTDVQTRDCARFKSTEASGVPSRGVSASVAN